jgi:hypothetical protein
MVRPLSSRPPDSRSIHRRPSGFSITSTIEGSSRKVAIAGPSAARSMRAPREKISEWSGVTPYHFRDQQMREVDIVLERDDGMIVGIEVKASATAKSGDFAGLPI